MSSPIISLPAFILMPVLFLFPFLPIALNMLIGNSLVARWQAVILGWDLQNSFGHFGWGGMDPGSVIGGCPEPMPPMGTIPLAAIEKNVYTDIGSYIYIGPGYNSHWRRGRDHDWRGGTDAYI
jgi:hypothetical protein